MAVVIPENIGKGLSRMDELEETLQALADAVVENVSLTAVEADVLQLETDMGIAEIDILNLEAINTARLAAIVTLNGKTNTPISFTVNTAAVVTSTQSQPYNLASVGTGCTVIVTPDGGAIQTVTITFTAGTSLSGTTPSLDISGGADSKFKIQVDGDTAEEVTLDLTAGGGINTGAKIAAEMQTKIRALGGRKAAVTVSHNNAGNAKYLITSAMLGTQSAIVITRATGSNVTEELKIGVADGGTEAIGLSLSSAIANAAAVTGAEMVALINANTTAITATYAATKIVLTSDTTGKDSSIVMGNSTLKTVLGLADAAEGFGAQGLGGVAMLDSNFIVCATLRGATVPAAKCLSIITPTTAGFKILCETAAATDEVSLLINP